MTLREYFLSKVEITPNCWLWRGCINSPNGTVSNGGGYGRLHFHGLKIYAHRAAYELFIGPIPEGLDLDHLCRNRSCVNPRHLEPVTRLTNILRGARCRTHCSKGHPYTPENTYPQRKQCRICRSARRRARYAAGERNV